MCRFFITQDTYFDFRGRSVQNGDKVAVLLGGKVPYVLRLIEGKGNVYRFVVDAYVHRILNGEAVEAADVELCTMKLR
jgi:hypothetical protein